MKKERNKIIGLIMAVFTFVTINTFAAPFLLPEYSLSEITPEEICVVNNMALIEVKDDLGHGNNSEIHVYDITNPKNVNYITKIWIPDTENSSEGCKISDIGVVNNLLLVTCEAKNETDITNCFSLQVTAIEEGEEITSLNSVAEVVGTGKMEISEKFLYIKGEGDGKVQSCKIMPRGFSRPVEIEGAYMDILTSETYMLKPNDNTYDIFEISTENIGQFIINFSAIEGIDEIISKDSYIYGKTASTVAVISVTSGMVQYIDIPNVDDMKIVDKYLFLSADGKMNVYDISNPDNISKLSQSGSNITAFAVNNGYVYGKTVYRFTPWEVIESEIFGGAGGEAVYKATVKNYTQNKVDVVPVIMIYKNQELEGITVEDNFLEAYGEKEIYAAINVPEGDYIIKGMIVNSLEELNLVSAEYSNMVLTQTTEISGTENVAEMVAEEEICISEPDENGKITVSGCVLIPENRPVNIVVTHESEVQFLDSHISDSGEYSFTFKPSESGIYNILINAADGVKKIEKTFEVADAKITAAEIFEKAETQAKIYIDGENMQNVDNISFEIATEDGVFDTSIAPNAEFYNGFSLENIAFEGEKIKVEGKCTGNVTISEKEICEVSVNISENAAIGQYELRIENVKFTDNHGRILDKEINNGILNIVEDLDRADKLEEANNSMINIKKVFGEEDYETQKIIVENAKEKISQAFDAGVREKHINQTYYMNLKSAEEILKTLEPKFTALYEIENAAKADIVGAVEKHTEVFNLDKDIWEIYSKCDSRVTDKDLVTAAIAEKDFSLPKNFNSELYEIIVLSMVENTNWGGIGDIIEKADNVLEITNSEYKNASYTKKTDVWKEIAGRKFETMQNLKEAIKAAMNTKESSVPNKVVGTSGSGGGHKVSSNVVFAPPKTEIPVEEKPESYPVSVAFKDLNDVPWAKEAIVILTQKGVVNGKTQDMFAPDDAVTREEFVKILVGAFNIESDIDCEFSDMEKDAWYYPYICAAVSKGIVRGTGNGTFGIGEKITREDMAVMIERVCSYADIVYKNAEAEKQFDDDEEISEYAKESVYILQKANLINGVSDNLFAPKMEASRAMAAKVVCDILNLREEEGA